MLRSREQLKEEGYEQYDDDVVEDTLATCLWSFSCQIIREVEDPGEEPAWHTEEWTVWRRKKDSLSHALEVFELFMMCILKLFKTLKRLNIVKCEVVSDSTSDIYNN